MNYRYWNERHKTFLHLDLYAVVLAFYITEVAIYIEAIQKTKSRGD